MATEAVGPLFLELVRVGFTSVLRAAGVSSVSSSAAGKVSMTMRGGLSKMSETFSLM